MNKQKLALIIAGVGIFVLIMVATVMELRKLELENEYKFAVKQVETATIKCINDSKCKMGKITIGELTEKEYMHTVINPMTKEPFGDKSYMVYPDLAFYDID